MLQIERHNLETDTQRLIDELCRDLAYKPCHLPFALMSDAELVQIFVISSCLRNFSIQTRALLSSRSERQ